MSIRTRHVSSIAILLFAALRPAPAAGGVTPAVGVPWPMHVIDDSSRGADGVRLSDVNGDKLPDIATGWEEGGITRLYLHPGHDKVGGRWPAVTVGRTPSVEDAVFVDLDGDGRTDVVSSCEGRTRTMFVHWAPAKPAAYLDPEAWKTEPIPASQDRQAWMFSLPMQVDGRTGIDLVTAGKGGGAEIGWFEAPERPRRLADWRWHPVSPAGWIMSLIAADFDGDGDQDIVTTDRKGPHRACRWLENPGPGPDQSKPWKNHVIGGADREVMFMAVADERRGPCRNPVPADLLVAVRPGPLLLFRRAFGSGESARSAGWELFEVGMPPGTGTGKGVSAGDVDGDGALEVVFSCEHAGGEKVGLMWLDPAGEWTDGRWTAHHLSGPSGIKFDRIELVDLDGDGDLDVLTCEESQPVDGKRRGLGVVWYENPYSPQRP